MRLLPGDLLLVNNRINSYVYFYFYDISTVVMYSIAYFTESNHCTFNESSNGGPVRNEELV